MKRQQVLTLMAVLTLLAGGVQAAMVEVPLELTADKASMIVQGTVLSQTSRWTADGRTIVTDVTIRVAEALKGAAKANDHLTFQIEGGEVGPSGIWVEHQPRFSNDQNVLLFLRPGNDGTLAVQHAEQGRFTIYQDQVLDYKGRTRDLTHLKTDIHRTVDSQGR